LHAKCKEKNKRHTGFLGRLEGRRQLGMPIRKWEDNIKVYILKERDEGACTGFVWPWIGFICVLVNTVYNTLRIS
jgi:hypothetical protein